MKGPHHFLALGNCRSQGFLDQSVDAGLGQPQPHAVVVTRRDRDYGGLDPGRNQSINIGQHLQLAGHPELVSGRISHGDQLQAGGFADIAHVVAAHRADSQDSYFNIGHLRHRLSPRHLPR